MVAALPGRRIARRRFPALALLVLRSRRGIRALLTGRLLCAVRAVAGLVLRRRILLRRRSLAGRVFRIGLLLITLALAGRRLAARLGRRAARPSLGLHGDLAGQSECADGAGVDVPGRLEALFALEGDQRFADLRT